VFGNFTLYPRWLPLLEVEISLNEKKLINFILESAEIWISPCLPNVPIFCIKLRTHRLHVFLLQDRLLKPLGGYVGYNSEWRELAQCISRVS
jgi:hypothetical protein